MISRRFYIILLLAMVILPGCWRREPTRPNGMPETTPCTLNVTFGGEKLEGVTVLLRPKDTKQNWAAGGTTDINGQSSLKTSGYYDGVIPGEYILSFQKTGRIELDKNDMPIRSYSLIPIKYTAGKSKETIVVTKEQAVYNFELDGGEELQK